MSALNFVIILLCVIVSILCIALKLLIADFREVRIKVLKLETFIEADDFADEFVNGLKDLHIDADRKTEPTISKMEQVDKDINVRSKTEPQYDIDKGTIKCDNCSENGSYKCTKCDGEMYFKRLEVEDEPQTERRE